MKEMPPSLLQQTQGYLQPPSPQRSQARREAQQQPHADRGAGNKVKLSPTSKASMFYLTPRLQTTSTASNGSRLGLELCRR